MLDIKTNSIKNSLNQFRLNQCNPKKGQRPEVLRRYEEHVKTCIFRKINCPDFDCESQVLFKDINDHIIKDHKDWSGIATKIDEKTFKVAYDKKNLGTSSLLL